MLFPVALVRGKSSKGDGVPPCCLKHCCGTRLAGLGVAGRALGDARVSASEPIPFERDGDHWPPSLSLKSFDTNTL